MGQPVPDERGVSDDFEVFEESTLDEELAEIPTGPGLAVRLASIDRAGLNADDMLSVADARQRLIAHQQAQLLADVHAVARKVPRVGRCPTVCASMGLISGRRWSARTRCGGPRPALPGRW